MAKTPTLASLIKSKSKSAKNILDALLNDAIKKGADSIHLESSEDEISLRYRVDGNLQKIKKLPLLWMEILDKHLKKLANIQSDPEIPQEGKFKIKIGKKDKNLIVGFWPKFEGQKITLKILNEPQLDKLPFNKQDLTWLQKNLLQKNGLVLITQIKLLDKNKLLYSLLREMQNEHLDIFTLEDFIESPLPGIHQQQPKNWKDEEINEHLQMLLRHNPDIVMISKITGPLLARTIIDAAMTNQIIIAYLPSNNLEDALEYLTACGVDPYVLESALTATIIQQNDQYKIV
jgi:type II secretory ATPase GspE/PulE/Tfp pilus assembly ATPase PilB-like protein